MSNLRNSQLLQQMKAHPLKATLARALDIAETFQGDVEFLQLNKDLSQQGRQNAMQAKLRAAIRDLRDARGPVAELEKKLGQKRAAVSMPAFKQDDVVGFLRRQELRAALRAMANAGQRALLLEDPAFADAMLEQPPALSGLQPQQIGEDKDNGNQDFLLVEAVKKRRLESLFAPQLAEIDSLAETVAEASSIVNIAHNDLKLHSGMDDRQFTEFVKPIEARQNAPWLQRFTEDGIEVIRVVDLENHAARIATEDEKRDGRYFKDFAEYQAARAA